VIEARFYFILVNIPRICCAVSSIAHHYYQITTGGSKVFRCPVCDDVILRDWNGALGLLLEALSGTTFTLCNEGDAIVAKCGDIPLSVA
jgi:transposase